MVDAIRSNRVEDDFSQRWSHAREDFERRLYGKRRKFKLAFVELDDVTPIVSPESDIIDRIVLSDFMSVIDEKNRQIVVLVTSGESNLSEVGRQLGYANNSAVQKRLRKLAVKAKRHLDLLD
jgi:DNA-directed RNA polymerase specialized sigma subunit